MAVTRELETPIRAVPHGALFQASKHDETISSAAQGLCSDSWRLARDCGQKNVLYWEHNNLAANLLLPNDSHTATFGLITQEYIVHIYSVCPASRVTLPPWRSEHALFGGGCLHKYSVHPRLFCLTRRIIVMRNLVTFYPILSQPFTLIPPRRHQPRTIVAYRQTSWQGAPRRPSALARHRNPEITKDQLKKPRGYQDLV